MRFGLSSYIYRYAIAGLGGRTTTRLGAIDLLKRAAALGLQVVQFCENLPLATLTGAEWEEQLGASRRLGVAIEVGTRSREVNALLAHVDLAAKAGSRVLRLVLGATDPDMVTEALRPVLRRCQERKVMLAIENHFDLRSPPRTGGGHPAIGQPVAGRLPRYGQLHRPAGRPFGDVCGARTLCRSSPPEGLRRREGNNRLPHHGAHPGTGLAGCGCGARRPWQRQRRDPDLFLEQWMEPEGSPEATLAKEQEWVEAGVRATRGYLAQRARQA